MKRCLLILCCLENILVAQEASSGFELRTTLSGAAAYSPRLEAAPRSGAPATAGFRSVLYPTWKLNENWTISGAFQAHSRPYFWEQFSSQGHGVKGDLLQAFVSYSRFWKDRSLVVRAGQLSSAFGSFLLRYDDADNPLIDLPLSYGYYYKPISLYGLAGAQVDVTLGRLDLRAQFANSSPTNRRSIFDSDQYGTWTGGVGYTVRQGLRLGVSAYRGPYLHRQYAYFFPGEAKPRDLPASGYGLDVQWGRGPWNVTGEWQRFQKAYRAISTLNQHTGYIETRRVLHPRIYVASRVGYERANAYAGSESYETVAGFRLSHHQLAKVGYQIQRGPWIKGASANTFAVQFVTAFRAISLARD